nr:hypothetical protein Itr_chr13CG16940 [Ipomoea trifida]
MSEEYERVELARDCNFTESYIFAFLILLSERPCGRCFSTLWSLFFLDLLISVEDTPPRQSRGRNYDLLIIIKGPTIGPADLVAVVPLFSPCRLFGLSDRIKVASPHSLCSLVMVFGLWSGGRFRPKRKCFPC